MNGDPALSDSFASAFGFLGDIVFKWVPSVVATISNSISASPGVESAATSTRPLAWPLSASDFPVFLESVSGPETYNSIAQGWYVFVLISLAICLPFIAVSIYCAIRIYFLRRHERKMLEAAQHPVAAKDIPKTQLRGARVLEQARGTADHGWRLAILEADIMLNELLDMQGLKGETMAEKMKQADRASFNSIDAAWEAHKIRNRIVHDGSAHPLNQREVRRVIGLYEKVFREFGYIS